MQGVALSQEFVHFGALRCLHADPRRLHGQHAVQFQVIGVHLDGRPSGLAEAEEPTHVVNVRVGEDDAANVQPVSLNEGEDASGIVAGIND
jgi:hypothetical protein